MSLFTILCYYKYSKSTQPIQMETLNDCTYVLLGTPIPSEYEVIGEVNNALKNENVISFKFNDALVQFSNENTPVGGAVRQLLKNGGKLPPSFISIIIEDFLHLNRGFGPIVFMDFPRSIEQMKRLDTALSFYRAGDVIINNYIYQKTLCESEEIEKILSFCRANSKYKISNFDTLSPEASVFEK